MYFAMGREYADSALQNLKLGGFKTLTAALKCIVRNAVSGEVRNEKNVVVLIIEGSKIKTIEQITQEDYDRQLRAWLHNKGVASVQYFKG